MIDRDNLKKKLPNGYHKEIALRAGVSLAAVSRYLNGITKWNLHYWNYWLNYLIRKKSC